MLEMFLAYKKWRENVSKSDDFAIVKCSENLQNELKSASTLAVLYENNFTPFQYTYRQRYQQPRCSQIRRSQNHVCDLLFCPIEF